MGHRGISDLGNKGLKRSGVWGGVWGVVWGVSWECLGGLWGLSGPQNDSDFGECLGGCLNFPSCTMSSFIGPHYADSTLFTRALYAYKHKL